MYIFLVGTVQEEGKKTFPLREPNQLLVGPTLLLLLSNYAGSQVSLSLLWCYVTNTNIQRTNDNDTRS